MCKHFVYLSNKLQRKGIHNMALITCHECKKEISDSAKSCPHCGAKPKASTSLFTLVAAAVVLAFIAQGACSPSTKTTTAPTPEQAAAKAKTEAEFQKVVMVAKWAKEQSKNPNSFELTYGGYTSNGTVCIEFRGTNSFNAVVPGRYIMSDTVSGSTPKLWNQHCANQSITDYSTAKHAL